MDINGIEWKGLIVHCPSCSTPLLLRICRDCKKAFLIDPMKPSQLPLDHTLDLSLKGYGDIGIVRHKTEDEQESDLFDYLESEGVR